MQQKKLATILPCQLGSNVINNCYKGFMPDNTVCNWPRHNYIQYKFVVGVVLSGLNYTSLTESSIQLRKLKGMCTKACLWLESKVALRDVMTWLNEINIFSHWQSCQNTSIAIC